MFIFFSELYKYNDYNCLCCGGTESFSKIIKNQYVMEEVVYDWMFVIFTHKSNRMNETYNKNRTIAGWMVSQHE